MKVLVVHNFYQMSDLEDNEAEEEIKPLQKIEV
jgi:hydrogenase maturation factor